MRRSRHESDIFWHASANFRQARLWVLIDLILFTIFTKIGQSFKPKTLPFLMKILLQQDNFQTAPKFTCLSHPLITPVTVSRYMLPVRQCSQCCHGSIGVSVQPWRHCQVRWPVWAATSVDWRGQQSQSSCSCSWLADAVGRRNRSASRTNHHLYSYTALHQLSRNNMPCKHCSAKYVRCWTYVMALIFCSFPTAPHC